MRNDLERMAILDKKYAQIVEVLHNRTKGII
jgi:hypothetical protein